MAIRQEKSAVRGGDTMITISVSMEQVMIYAIGLSIGCALGCVLGNYIYDKWL